jgi:hypothetical protein
MSDIGGGTAGQVSRKLSEFVGGTAGQVSR